LGKSELFAAFAFYSHTKTRLLRLFEKRKLYTESLYQRAMRRMGVKPGLKTGYEE